MFRLQTVHHQRLHFRYSEDTKDAGSREGPRTGSSVFQGRKRFFIFSSVSLKKAPAAECETLRRVSFAFWSWCGGRFRGMRADEGIGYLRGAAGDWKCSPALIRPSVCTGAPSPEGKAFPLRRGRGDEGIGAYRGGGRISDGAA